MSDSSTRWPRKTHELHNHHFDSTVWNDFKFRDDDIVITPYRQVRHDLAGGRGADLHQ
jgi:hypothetical protein